MRTKSTLINTIAGIIQRILPSLLAFVTRTVFINIFGATYLGVDSLFTEVLTMLSLVELGVGNAMTYFLYKPLANENIEKIKSLMKLYERVYRIIGIAVGLIGVLLVPFLDIIVKTEKVVPHLTLIYLLMLANTVVSYFFTYKRSIFLADQKNYINSIVDTIFLVVRNVVGIIFILTTHNYLIYLSGNVVITILNNIFISKKANSKYPYLTDNKIKKLESAEIKHIFSRVGAFFLHRLGGTIALGTDNLMMSLFTSVEFIGVYSNYGMITKLVNTIFTPFTANITASVGNLDATSNGSKAYEIFKKADFINYFLYAFGSICLTFLLNPFIEFWLGEKYVLPRIFLIFIIINFYLGGIRQTTISFSNAKGYFWETRFKPVIESVVDIVIGLILGKLYGPIGVLVGTTAGFLLISLWVEPYYLYSKWFRISPFKYLYQHINYVFKVLLCLLIIYFPVEAYLSLYQNITITVLLGLFFIVILLAILSLILFNIFSEEFKFIINIVIKIYKKIILR